MDGQEGGVMGGPLREDQFIPGLKPRGHEDVLGWTPAELLASLPAPAAGAWLRPDDDEGPLEWAESDHTTAREYLRRHGHRSE